MQRYYITADILYLPLLCCRVCLTAYMAIQSHTCNWRAARFSAVCMLDLCLCGFSPGAPVSSHRSKDMQVRLTDNSTPISHNIKTAYLILCWSSSCQETNHRVSCVAWHWDVCSGRFSFCGNSVKVTSTWMPAPKFSHQNIAL